MNYPPALRRLINELIKLPTIGEKTALRLAYQIVLQPSSGAQLSEAIRSAVEQVRLCEECFSLTEEQVCAVCQDPSRSRDLICVVEKPTDVYAVERSGSFRGLYHVLHGLWSPLKGVGPDDTRLDELLKRLSGVDRLTGRPFEEVLLATGTTVEGDATALYIAHRIAALGIKSTRIAQGLPKGGELEFVDDVTLTHAIAGRKSL